MTSESRYMSREIISAKTMSQCQVLMVSATIINSVRMRAVNDMATTWMNSSSNRSKAPNMITPPKIVDFKTYELVE